VADGEVRLGGVGRALLLLGQLHERRPVVEPVDDRLAAAATGNAGLDLVAGELGAVGISLPTLALMTAGVLLGR
jgi:hypothetical protein